MITAGFKPGEPKHRTMVRGRMEAARAACDRLVVGVEALPEPDESDLPRLVLAETASLSSVDLVCLFAEGSQQEALQRLLPDLLIDASPGAKMAELVRGWGGVVVAG